MKSWGILATLGESDRKAMKSWFATQTGSKIAVIFGFALVLLGADVLTYFGARFFFNNLSPLGTYGRLTAEYIMRSVYVVIAGLGIGSSLATTANMVFSANKEYFYLATLPIKEKYIVAWLGLRTIMANWFFVLLVLFPISAAFTVVFGTLNPAAIVSIIMIGGGLAIFANSVGGFIAYIGAIFFKKYDTVTTSVGVGLFLLILIGIFRLILPADLARLTILSNDSFFTIYNNLPLVKWNIPVEYLVVITVVLTGLFLAEQNRNFLNLTKEMSAAMMAPQFTADGKNPETKSMRMDEGSQIWVLAIKDLLGIIRSPVEFSYGLFLLLLALGFFWLLSRANIQGGYLPEWITYLTTFAYAGMIFFANTYLLRLVYPLVAKESVNSWYLFSLPLAGKKILNAKMITAGIFSLPLIIIGAGLWMYMPFIYSQQVILILSTMEVIMFVTLFQLFSGTIWPNFTDGDNSERVSTSATGLLTLAGTGIIIALSTWGIYLILGQKIAGANFLIIQTGLIIIISMLMYNESVKEMGKYQF